MTVTISTNGRLTLPAELRRQDGIDAGERFVVEWTGPAQYMFTRESEQANAGLVDWLLSCPVKGFNVPLESESTDRLIR